MTMRRGLLGGVVIGILVAGWIGIAALERSQVDVHRSGPIDCTGGEVVEVTGGDDERAEAIRMVPDMHCLVPVEVTNDGWLPVTVEGALLPLMGPGGGAGVQSQQLNGAAFVEPPDDPRLGGADNIDAYFVVDRSLSRGETLELVMEFTYRPGGCSTEDGLMSFDAMPVIAVSALGLGGTRDPDARLSFQGTSQSSCDS